MAGGGPVTSPVSPPLPVSLFDLAPDEVRARRVIMVTSPGWEPTRAVVAVNLATVCAESGQRVAMVSTDGMDELLAAESEVQASPRADGEHVRRFFGHVTPADVRDLLEETKVPGISLLALQHFVSHPTRLVIRVPEVLDALLEVVDVVILDVPSFLSVHHGEGLAPLADVVLVVGEFQSTTSEQVRRISAQLTRLGAPVVGMALTNAPGSPEDRRGAEPGTGASHEPPVDEPKEDATEHSRRTPGSVTMSFDDRDTPPRPEA
jgi:Mrp family chromosome partitioning ATPase